MSDRTDLTTREENLAEKKANMPTIAPLVDIYENDDEIMLHADMPGVEKDNININIDNGKLEISAQRLLNFEGVSSWEEFGNVEYRRIFSIPQSIDVGEVRAELTNGVLKLHLPKSEAAKPRTIEISAV